MTLDRRDPGDTRGLLAEYARGHDPIRAAGFWLIFVAAVFGWAYLIIWLIARAL